MGVKKIGMERRFNNNMNNLSKLNGTRDYFLRNGLILFGTRDDLGFDPSDLMSARRLWVLHKDELMSHQDLKNPGWRPWAWWRFEQDTEPANFHYGERLIYLRGHKLLTDWELKLLDNPAK